MNTFMTALRTTLVTLMITGIVYPFAVTFAARLLFPEKAAGSLIFGGEGEIRGSVSIGQNFTKPWYFNPRPSAAGSGYDSMKSGGSNFSPASSKLRERIGRDLDRIGRENPGAVGPVPAELVQASGSGLDPHITPEAALWQIPRIATSRNVDPAGIRKIVGSLTEGRDFGIFGEPRVNVLRLNLALDKTYGIKTVKQ